MRHAAIVLLVFCVLLGSQVGLAPGAAAPPQQEGTRLPPTPAPTQEKEKGGKREGDRREAHEWFYGQRAAPFEHVPDNALLRARQQLDASLANGAMARVAQGNVGSLGTVTEGVWSPIGPQPIAAEQPGFSIGEGALPNSGRVTAIVVDPSDANTVYIGAADGGVWKTTNGGTTWSPITDTQPSLNIGALALDPSNANVIYAGLGEQHTAVDAYFGMGILKSTNAGVSWTLLNDPIFDRQRIGRIAVDPNNTQIVYAATTAGIARSLNGGTTWTTACLAIDCWVTDVVIDSSTSPSTVYASHGYPFGATGNGVYKTTTNLANTNVSWTKVPGTGANVIPTSGPGAGTGRIRLSITRGFSPPTMYAAVHRVQDAALTGIWKTTDGGANWMQTATHPETGLPANSFSICAQCWYNLNIAVYPTNPDVIYVLATEMFRSTNGGATWTLISNSYTGTPAKIHTDQHGFDFMPGNPNGFYVGNDGGAYKSTDGGATFSNLNQTLSITQFYRGAIHPSDPNIIVGGTQDNGTLSYFGAPGWYRPFGADGGYAQFDVNHPNFVYGETQNLGLQRSVNGPHGFFQNASTGIPCNASDSGCVGGERRQFIAPFVSDPVNPQTLYAGTSRLYKTTNRAATWSAVSPDLSSAANSANTISAIAVAKSSSSSIYVGTGSSPSGSSRLWVTTNGGTNWTNRTAGLPNRSVTSIAAHPTVPTTAYVALSGFDTGHVWRTTNGGVNWTDVSGTLPNAPFNAVVIDPANPQRLYVGTDVGVFKSTDGGATWAALNAGLPTVVVNDLVLHGNGTRLVAFTHGRGAYVLDRTGVTGPTQTPVPTAVTNPTCGSVQATNASATLGAGSQSPLPNPPPRGEGTSVASPRGEGTSLARVPPIPGGANALAGGGFTGGIGHVVAAPEPRGAVRPATGPGWTTIVCETFEGPWPTGGWSTGSRFPVAGFDVCWGTSTFQPYPGSTKSAWHNGGCTNALDPIQTFYGPATNSWMVYGPFSLVGATAAEVHFQRWHQIKGSFAGQLSGDGLFVVAFTPDSNNSGFVYTGNTTAVEPPTTQGWVSTTFDLANVPTLGSLLGKPEVYVAWVFQSDNGTGAASLDDGAFIDDVLIHRFGNVPPSPTNTPTAGPATPTRTATAGIATVTPTRTATAVIATVTPPLVVTATRTATQAPGFTVTPTPAAVAGRDFTLRAGPPGLAFMTWQPGTLSTGEIIIRYSGNEGLRFLPANLVPLGPTVTSYTDSGPLSDEAYCYLEMSVSGSPPVVSNDTFMGFSDFLCLYTGGQGGNPPANVSIALNQTRTATIRFTQPPGGGQTGYRTTVSTFNGAADQVFTTADPSVTQFAHDTTGLSTCYKLEALLGGAVLGTAKKVCAVPDIYFAIAGEPMDLQTAFERVGAVLERVLLPNGTGREE